MEGRRLRVIVSGRIPACWHCGKIGHLSEVFPEKKALKKPDQKPCTFPPVVTNTEKEAPVDISGYKKSHSSPTVSTEESGAKWLTVGKGGRKIQPADPHSRKTSQVGTNSSPHSQKQPKSNTISSPSASKSCA